jgi:myo-inositol-1(or 4)-monophosphatase
VNRNYLQAAVDIARESGALLADCFARGVRSEAKGRFDLVTEADRAAEALILGRLRAEFPSHTVVAEESGKHAGSSASCRWYVDPLDGTKNFARGYPAFTLSIALEYADQLVLGVVFDPIRQEMFSAERGAGAFCNNTRIHVSAVDRVEQCLVTTGFPSATRHRHSNMHLFCQVSMTTQGLRRTGSSALDLSYVASGRVDAFWDIGLSAWDVAAGLVLVSEAGGSYSDLRGRRFSLSAPDLLADNALVHDSFVQMFGSGLDTEGAVTACRSCTPDGRLHAEPLSR